MKNMTYRDKLQKRQRLLHWIMDAAYIREHPEMIQRKERCSLKQKRLCTENPGTHFEQLYTYLIKCINKFKRLILLFIFPCVHLETATVQQRLETGPTLY